MRALWSILVLLLFVAGCQAQLDDQPRDLLEEAPPQNDHSEHENHQNADEHHNHNGCQEDEVDEKGNCVPADANNAQLFDQDFTGVVTTQSVDEEVLKGFYARPSNDGNYPGVVMIHEWWGLNDNIKEMAQILASEGYHVFAIDLYDGNVAETSDDARTYATNVRSNPDQAVEKMQLAVDYLQTVGAPQVGSMGWCFGGQQSLLLSLNEPLDATVIYYGQLVEDTEQLQSLDGPVLGIFGAEDGGIPPSAVNSFESALNSIDHPNDIHIYDGVGHAFANPSGSNYAAAETVDAWTKTVAFLNMNLKAMHHGMDHGMHDVNSEEEFIVEMIPHHQEAVDTSLIIVENSQNAELIELAQRIIDAQRSEIEMMQMWLEEDYDGGYEPTYQHMMRDLLSYSGTDQDTVYIEDMILHHQMAVMMAEQVLALEPSQRVANFAQNVIDVQNSEIAEMQALLQTEPDVTFVLEGENFAYYLDGQEAPELVVQEGDLVRIEFTSIGGYHDWVVDEFGRTGFVSEGESTYVEFVADQTGTFEYYCSVGSHRANGMVGNLVVE